MLIVEYILQGLAILGVRYSPEEYLLMTKIQCLLWTAADLVIVFYLTRIANHARAAQSAPLHFWPFVFLGATLLFVPFVPIAQTGTAIFRLELLITVPHFLLILYVMIVNVKVFPGFIAGLAANPAARPNQNS